MRIFKRKTHFDFVGIGHIAVGMSALLTVASIVLLMTRGLNFGLDFTGGTLIEVSYPEPPAIADVRQNLASAGFDNAVVQTFGKASDIVVRIPPSEDGKSSADTSAEVMASLQQGVEGEVSMRRVEFVGPQVGDDLTEQGILAVIYALIGIFFYVMFRFQWRFSVGATIATVHDVVVVMGFLSLFQIEFDLTVVAGLLAVIGYSLNDTIVIFDRIRENFPRMLKSTPREVVNASVNETLSRSVMTSLTTLITMVALYLFGGQIISAFSFTMIVGIVFGAYSSIYIASMAALYLGVSKYDLMKVEKEGSETVSHNRP